MCLIVELGSLSGTRKGSGGGLALRHYGAHCVEVTGSHLTLVPADSRAPAQSEFHGRMTPQQECRIRTRTGNILWAANWVTHQVNACHYAGVRIRHSKFIRLA